MKIKVVLFLFFLIISRAVQGQDLSITPNLTGDVTYCNQAVFLAPNFTMSASSSITGMKISISLGYRYGEDELRLTGYTGQVKSQWFGVQGYLKLTGGSTVDDYVLAMRQVQYLNNSTTPTNGGRTITFSLDDADYLPETHHFYKFINTPGYKWTDAKTLAESVSMKYHGLQGYLATITSQAEDEFIQQKTSGVGWIGASDQTVEGEWRWLTGPEGLMDGGKGLLFWKGSGGQAKADPLNYGPVKDPSGNPYYQNWNRWNTTNPTNNPMHYEPNDNSHVNIDHEEDYAHITFFPNNPSESKKWNDYPNSSSSQGYVIEYGGMPGDPQVNLTADIVLWVNTIRFSANQTFTRCQGDTVRLNRPDNFASYLWRPATGLSGSAVSNPLAKPDITTEYTVVATNGICHDSVKFTVNVNPAPVSKLKKLEDICFGDKIILDPGLHAGYLWNTGATTQTLTVTESGHFRVVLTGSNGCKLTDSVDVVVHQYPKMDLSNLNTLTCGSLTTTLDIKSNKGTYVLTNMVTSQQFSGTTVTVPAFGNYLFTALVTDPYGCTTDTTMTLLFHKIPKVNLTIDETECYGYNLQASYVGDATVPVSRFTWIFGGDTISNKLGQNIEQIPLGINQKKRDLVLKVTEDGCTGGNALTDILVIPDLALNVKKNLQCQPVPFEFSATNTENVVKYEWDWGDGTKGAGKTATHLYAKEGYYDVNLVVTTDKGCTNSVTMEKMVYVAPIPTVGFSLTPEMCLNPGKNTVSYVGSAGNKDTYYWDLKGFDPVEIAQSPDTTAGPFVFDLINKPKTSLSLYVISQYGCRSTTASIEIKRKPVFSFSASTKEGCAPVTVGFMAQTGDPVDQLDFLWNYGDGDTEAGKEVNHTYQEPNLTHDLRLQAVSSVTGCRDSLYQPGYIVVHPNPKAGFTMDHDIVYNDMPKVVFQDLSTDAVSYYWNFGDGTHSREKNPEHSYNVVGKRKVLQTVYNQFDCQDTTSKVVLVAFSRIFAPNAFSPNAPAAVDRMFKLASEGIKPEGYHLTIFSRWNDIVFECKNEVKGWDGKMGNGSFAPAGNYIWILECFDFLGRPHKQSGSLTLVY